jgi:Cu+-exporting ATPase
VRHDAHDFCCDGCAAVYDLLRESDLCAYYDLEKVPGNVPPAYPKEKWAFLDDRDIEKSLLQFRSAQLAIVTLQVPGLHCTSCIYLLENLGRLMPGIASSEVNFLKKEILVKYDPTLTSLRKLVERLAAIGYPPVINLAATKQSSAKTQKKSEFYRIGVAGFCFANIMVLSLPEYFDTKGALTPSLIQLFRILNAVLVIPAFAYSAGNIFRSAFAALRVRSINMDLPVALGLTGLAIQSYFEVITGTGGGYFDSMSGFIFFLLVGRFFQNRTQQSLSFDRDYTAYFPLAVTRIRDAKTESVRVTELKKYDLIEVHHDELIPADSLLETNEAEIDYAFVTGESRHVDCKKGEFLYAGGRNKGQKLRLRVMEEVSQSYLTKLWNAKAYEKQLKGTTGQWASRMAGYFTVAVIIIATFTGIYWAFTDSSVMMRAITSTLIVACPCVLALTLPFTFGAVMRIFSRNGLFLKNGECIENLAKTDTIILDKTGTLSSAATSIRYEGEPLTNEEKNLIAGVAEHSAHPVSRTLAKIAAHDEYNYPITNWKEVIGSGVEAEINGNKVRIGQRSFVGDNLNPNEQGTFVSINGEIKGFFRSVYTFRSGLKSLVKRLSRSFRLFVLSGDDSRDEKRLLEFFKDSQLFFRQTPADKVRFIAHEQAKGHYVMMIGDGLNDAPALQRSDFGITVTDDINSFTPAADAILDAEKINLLPRFTAMARRSKYIVFGSFIFSTLYNFVGLSFAVQGRLEPWVVAILMPISSITVILYTQISTRLMAKKYKL